MKTKYYLYIMGEEGYKLTEIDSDYLEIVGTQEELDWLHSELTRKGWYRI